MGGNQDNRIDKDFGMDLGNKKYLKRVGNFYRGEVMNGNGGSTIASVARIQCA